MRPPSTSGRSHLLWRVEPIFTLYIAVIYATHTHSASLQDSKGVFLNSASVEVKEAVTERQVFQVGNFVVPGIDWKDGDKSTGGIGRVNAAFNDGWLQVKWANGKTDLHWGSGNQLRVVNDATGITTEDLQSNSCQLAPPGNLLPCVSASLIIRRYDLSATRTAANTSTNESDLHIGAKVLRGPDWIWGEQDGGAGCIGKVVEIALDNWVDVRWISNIEPEARAFRFNLNGAYDIVLLLESNSQSTEPDIYDTTILPDSIEKNGLTTGTDAPIIPVEQRTTAELEQMAKNVYPGSWVRRSRDWMWDSQDGSPRTNGEVVRVRPDKWVRVRWFGSNKRNNYRLGYKNKYDVELIEDQPDLITTTPRATTCFNCSEPENLMIGDQVVRGPNWCWGEQDGGAGQSGTVMSNINDKGWIRVRWNATGISNMYRLKIGKVDLRLADPTATQTLYPQAPLNTTTLTENASESYTQSSLELAQQQPITSQPFNLTTQETPVQNDFDLHPPPISVGDQVKRGRDWIWDDQDGNDTGIVTRKIVETYWVLVRWKNGKTHAYRYSQQPYGPRDLQVLPTDDITLQHQLIDDIEELPSS